MQPKTYLRLAMPALCGLLFLGVYACEKADSGNDSETSSAEAATAKNQTNSIVDDVAVNVIDKIDSREVKEYCLYTIDTITLTTREPGADKYVQGATLCHPCPTSGDCPEKDNKGIRFYEDGVLLAGGRYSGGGKCKTCPEGGIKSHLE